MRLGLPLGEALRAALGSPGVIRRLPSSPRSRVWLVEFGRSPAIEHYADGRVDPSRIAQVSVGLEHAAEALAGKISTGAGTKIHIDPCA